MGQASRHLLRVVVDSVADVLAEVHPADLLGVAGRVDVADSVVFGDGVEDFLGELEARKADAERRDEASGLDDAEVSAARLLWHVGRAGGEKRCVRMQEYRGWFYAACSRAHPEDDCQVSFLDGALLLQCGEEPRKVRGRILDAIDRPVHIARLFSLQAEAARRVVVEVAPDSPRPNASRHFSSKAALSGCDRRDRFCLLAAVFGPFAFPSCNRLSPRPTRGGPEAERTARASKCAQHHTHDHA